MIVKDINIKETNLEEIVEKFNLDNDLLLDVQDASEISRYLEKDGYAEVILKYPVKNGMETLGIHLAKETIMILHSSDLPFEINTKHKTSVFILVDILYKISESYFKIFKNLDKKIRKIKAASKTSVRNKDLLTLFELQDILDDYIIGLKGNLLVLGRIMLTNPKNDFINDAKIEIEQALETAISYSKTVSNLKGTLEIITNNLTNKRMESLTIVNVSALIITSISGLYGMNVRLPFSNLSNVFYYIILVSIILAFSFGFYLKRKFSEKR